jgi:hypothetical protein
LEKYVRSVDSTVLFQDYGRFHAMHYTYSNMVSRIRPAVQHLHRSLRLDENLLLNPSNPLQLVIITQKQLLKKEKDNYLKLSASISQEYDTFYKYLHSRSQTPQDPPAEIYGKYYYFEDHTDHYRWYRPQILPVLST